MEKASPVAVVSCGILKSELGALGYRAASRDKLISLDSMLHMRPAVLDAMLKRTLSHRHERRTLVVYGDCSPHMMDFTRMRGVAKVDGVNCCEIVLGRERYRTLRREGVFFFMPEWTLRWEEVFKNQLGFSDQPTARAFMHEMHTRIIYLDTSVHEVPANALKDIEAFMDLPVEILPTGLEHLQASVDAGLATLQAIESE